MNKKIGLLFAVLFLSTLLVGLASVSAVSPNVPTDSNWIDITIIYIQHYSGPVWGASAKIVSPVIGATGEIRSTDGKIIFTANEVILARFLLFILLVSIVWGVAAFMPFFTASWQKTLLTVVVSILGVRFLNNEMIISMLLPYGAFAIAVSILVPFILYAVFVQRALVSSVARKAAWIVFGVAMLFLGIYRWDALGDFAWFYPLTAVVCGSMVYFDKHVHAWFARAVIESTSDAAKRNQLNLITAKIDWANSVIAANGNPCPAYPAPLGAVPTWIPAAGAVVTDVTISHAKKFIKDQNKAIRSLL